MRPHRLISCAVIVGALVAFGAVPASAKGPFVTATPHRLLADGQQVMVSAGLFAPNTSMAVVECPTDVITPGTCDLNTVIFTETDASGSYTDVPFTVSRILGDGTDCALNGGCYIGTQDAGASGPTASRLITFDPDIPPLPQLEIAVRIDKTPKVNDKGVVALRGTLECRNRPAEVEVDIELSQVFDRAIFRSYGYAYFSCAADTKTPFRMTIRPLNGIFGPGPAVVRVQAYANNIFLSRRVAVDLQARSSTSAPSGAKSKLTWR
jgi:Neocarzinostatin family